MTAAKVIRQVEAMWRERRYDASLELDAGDEDTRSRTLLWLGYAYEGAGDDRARECYERILSLAAAPEERKAKARERLSGLPGWLARKVKHGWKRS
ncbi:MAG: hypothetical protein ACRD96_21775 [Bryobacteraceae bacterium]